MGEYATCPQCRGESYVEEDDICIVCGYSLADRVRDAKNQPLSLTEAATWTFYSDRHIIILKEVKVSL